MSLFSRLLVNFFVFWFVGKGAGRKTNFSKGKSKKEDKKYKGGSSPQVFACFFIFLFVLLGYRTKKAFKEAKKAHITW